MFRFIHDGIFQGKVKVHMSIKSWFGFCANSNIHVMMEITQVYIKAMKITFGTVHSSDN